MSVLWDKFNYSSLEKRWRLAFFLLWKCFTLSRFSRAATDGLVGLRFFGSRAEVTINVSALAYARSRFILCERSSLEHNTNSSPFPLLSRDPNVSLSLLCSRSERPFKRESGKCRVTLVLTLFTFWPPGPPDREKLISAELRIDCRSKKISI